MAHVTFVHGIANKVDPESLERVWVDALRDGDGLDLRGAGVSISQCYWADVLYATPLAVTVSGAEAAGEGEMAGYLDDGTGWFAALPPDEQAAVRELAAELGAAEAVRDDDPSEPAEPDDGLERIPLPGPLKRRLMRAVLRDVHHYLWDTEFTPRPGSTFRVRQEVRRRMVDALAQADGHSRPHVVVGHSLGSVIAYDVLQNDDRARAVDGLLTLGSPLGLDEVQDRLTPGWSRWDGFPRRAVPPGRWVNVYDRLDPVCGLDAMIATDFRADGVLSVRDVHEPNWGTWRHAVEKYLSGAQLRSALAELLGIG